MKKLLRSLLVISIGFLAFAQNNENNPNQYNSADNLLIQDSELLIGGYSEVHYNQPLPVLMARGR